MPEMVNSVLGYSRYIHTTLEQFFFLCNPALLGRGKAASWELYLLLQHKHSQDDHLFNLNGRAAHEGWGGCSVKGKEAEGCGVGWGAGTLGSLLHSGAFPKEHPFRQFTRAFLPIPESSAFLL